MDIVHSSEPGIQGQGYAFTNFGHTKTWLSFQPNDQPFEALLDTGSHTSMVGMSFLRYFPHIQVMPMAQPRSIVIGVHSETAAHYVILDFYFRGKLNGRPAIAHFRGEAVVIPELFFNFLIGTDIMIPQHICLDFGRRVASLGCCSNIEIPLKVTNVRDELAQQNGLTTSTNSRARLSTAVLFVETAVEQLVASDSANAGLGKFSWECMKYLKTDWTARRNAPNMVR